MDLTTSAFVQNRKKIKPELFIELLFCLNQEFYTDNDERIKLWNEFRLLAIDGSTILLPNTEELKEKYGVQKNQHKTEVVKARCSMLYDLENKFIVDGRLVHCKEGEKKQAIKHLKHTTTNDLVLLDRGYPCYELFHEFDIRGVNYVVRCKLSFSRVVESFVNSKLKSQVLTLEPTRKSKSNMKLVRKEDLKVRLVKVVLDSGQIEVLITSLINEEKYPIHIFKSLYSKRWGIETNYNFLKNILEVESFSSYSPESIVQDFYATLFIRNLQSLLISELDEEVEKKYGRRKHKYKINDSLSIGLLKGRIVELLMSDSSESALEEIKKLLLKHVVPIRLNRKNEREKNKYSRRKKPKVLKNRKSVL